MPDVKHSGGVKVEHEQHDHITQEIIERNLPLSITSLEGIPDEAWKIGAARANLTAYKYYVSPKFSHVWDARHQRVLDEKLMAVERGEIKRLIVNMPPRHFKSQTATAHFPAWYLGRNPDNRVMTSSYAMNLVEKFSRRRQTRGQIALHGEKLFNIRLSRESRR